jgi:hypothetical protein
MKLIVGQNDNPVIILSSVFAKTIKNVEAGTESKLVLNSGSEVTHVPTMARFLARSSKPNLYGDDLKCQSEVDHFLRFGQRLDYARDVSSLNDTLLSRTFLIGKVRFFRKFIKNYEKIIESSLSKWYKFLRVFFDYLFIFMKAPKGIIVSPISRKFQNVLF